MCRKILGGLMALLLLTLVSFSERVDAAEMTFRFKNNHPNIVSLQLFSQSRNHVWPNARQAWKLDDSLTKEYRITCKTGEKICYGAWLSRNSGRYYWGVGKYNEQSCTNCCSICRNNDMTVIRNLNR